MLLQLGEMENDWAIAAEKSDHGSIDGYKYPDEGQFSPLF
jgi:hypothetical protein